MDHCELHNREEGDGELLEPLANATAFLQPADRLLADAATPVGLPVEDGSAVMSALLVFRARNQRLDAALPKLVPHTVVAVAFVTSQSLWPLAWPPCRPRNCDLIHHRLDACGFPRLPGGHFDRQRQASTVSDQVALAAESASRAAQSVLLALSRGDGSFSGSTVGGCLPWGGGWDTLLFSVRLETDLIADRRGVP